MRDINKFHREWNGFKIRPGSKYWAFWAQGKALNGPFIASDVGIAYEDQRLFAFPVLPDGLVRCPYDWKRFLEKSELSRRELRPYYRQYNNGECTFWWSYENQVIRPYVKGEDKLGTFYVYEDTSLYDYLENGRVQQNGAPFDYHVLKRGS